MSDVTLEDLSEDDRSALLAETYKLIDSMMDSFRELYGEIGVHSKNDGSWCIHLGDDTKGCQQSTFMSVLLHGVDHYMGDAGIEDAMEHLEFPDASPEEGD